MNTENTTPTADSGRLPDAARYAAADLIAQLDAAGKDASYWATHDLRDRRDYHAGRAAAYRDAADMVREQHNATSAATEGQNS